MTKAPRDGCGRQFSVVSNLRRHFKLHTTAANKSALSIRQQQQQQQHKTQHSAIRVAQHQMPRTTPPAMPRRLLPAIPSSLMIPTPPMINVMEPSTDGIAATTTMAPPPPSTLSFNHDENGHMPMWANPYMTNYSITSQLFIDGCHVNSGGSLSDTTTSVPPPSCATNLFSFQFYMDTTTESPMTTFHVADDSSNSRTMMGSHMCPSFLSHHEHTT